MDVLSDAIAAMRTGRPYSALEERRGTWRSDFDSFTGAGFHVVLQGSCRLIPREGSCGPVLLGPGDVAFLPHGTAHALADTAHADDRSGSPTVLLCGSYCLDHTRAHPLLASLPELVHLPARVTRHPALRSAITLLGGELEAPGPAPGTDAALPTLLELLLIYLLRAWFEEQSATETTGWCAALSDPAVGAALRCVHDDPSKPWTVEELGARAGLSRAAFARRFTALVGTPPLTYLTWWRLTTAARLLRESDAPLASVAQRVGYSSQFAFANAFKREFGVPAGRYRRERREDHEHIALPPVP